MRSTVITLTAALAFATQLAGCPTPADALTAAAVAANNGAASSAGTTSSTTPAPRDPTRYWIQQNGNTLHVYRLPDARDADGANFDLQAGTTWFTGDGLYEFSGEYNWQRIDEGGLTLDEVLQTLDLAPAAG